MTHHPEKSEEINFNALFYIVGLLTGLFIGVVTGCGVGFIISLGIVGLLFAALFINVFVRGR
ncbi:MAG: hypothetical protein ABI203_01380, partial [Mucilaginibacter sp.]